MTTMVIEVYDALRSAGVPEDKARRAAEAIASYDPLLAALRTDLLVVKWQVAALLVLISVICGPILFLVLRGAKVGGLP
jgi:hypothetical protein